MHMTFHSMSCYYQASWFIEPVYKRSCCQQLGTLSATEYHQDTGSSGVDTFFSAGHGRRACELSALREEKNVFANRSHSSLFPKKPMPVKVAFCTDSQQ